LNKAIVGQQEFIDQVLITVLCGGHALIEGVPGLAKTLAVKMLARSLQVEFQRVQSTSDLMPADLLGTNVLNLSTGALSLLEAMEERQITIDGARHQLSDFFSVFATQNPVEFEGTYPLPEAQLDRFLLKIKVGYPSVDDEIRILEKHHGGFDPHALDAMGIVPLDSTALRQARGELRQLTVEPALFRYVTEIARRTREWPSVALGASPRAGLSLLLVAKGMAAVEGRDYVIPDDVKAAAHPVLRHRMLLKPEAELEALTTDNVITDVLAAVEVPK